MDDEAHHQSQDDRPDVPVDQQETDPLLAVRAQLDTVDDLPLGERAEVFERTHEVVVEELRALELG